MAGCRAVVGEAASKIAEELSMSREYVYQQKEKVQEYTDQLDNAEPKALTIKIDKRNTERTILSLSLDCHASIGGIQRFFERIYHKQISVGYISGVLQEAAVRAQAFDEGIDLSGINQGANDEIFQCGTPILVGIDPESTYTYLLEEASDRTAETWAIYLSDRKEHGLELSTSINDGGKGLMAGIPQVYPDVEMQADTFHVIYGMGKEISRVERNVYKLINGEYALKANLESKKPRKKNEEKLTELRPKTAEKIKIYDKLYILFSWIKEMLSFSGYNLEDSVSLLTWILQEMEAIAVNEPGIGKEVSKVLKMLPNLLIFIKRLEGSMETCARETGIPAQAFQLMYRQRSYSASSEQSNEIQCQLVYMLRERYTEANDHFQKMLTTTKKASSLVENLNGRIRVYMEVKRVVPTRFFTLMKVYFNTRRYSRSRCRERIGKSPLEILTGISQPEFLEALGY